VRRPVNGGADDPPMTRLSPPRLPPPPPSLPQGVAARLQREWDRLRYRPPLIERARAWAVTDQPFDDLDELLALAGFRTATDATTAAVLRGLVVRATDDELAARIVLQRVLPGLLAIVRRRPARRGDDALEHLAAAAWIAIRTFDPSRRPACLAAALIDEADHAYYCRPGRRRKSTTEITFDPARATGMPEDRRSSAFEELTRVLAEAHAAGLPDADLEIVQRLLRTGSLGQVARDLGVTTRTVRNRRDRVTLRVRQLALAA
jgi:DNA-directed RNA polymerase specialized sigma24 family protein